MIETVSSLVSRGMDLLKAGVALLFIRSAGTVLTPGRILALLERLPFHPRLSERGAAYRDNVTWTVDKAGRFLAGSKRCAVQALTACFFLRNGGYPHTLKVGAMYKQPGRIAVHMWVESDQRIIIGALSDLSLYRPLSLLEQRWARALPPL